MDDDTCTIAAIRKGTPQQFLKLSDIDLSINPKMATKTQTNFSPPDHKPEEDRRFDDFERILSPEEEAIEQNEDEQEYFRGFDHQVITCWRNYLVSHVASTVYYHYKVKRDNSYNTRSLEPKRQQLSGALAEPA